MEILKLSTIIAFLSFSMSAQANEVLLSSNQPIKVTYRVVHKHLDGQPVFGKLETVSLNKNVNIPIDLGQYDRAGIVIVSADGHELPSSANQFDQAQQCSMTTDKTKATGALEFTLTKHEARCKTFGGVFG